MVNVAELQKQEELIKQEKEKAQIIANEEIPQRRFGSGVTSKVQQQYIQRKQQAEEYVGYLKEKEKEVQGAIKTQQEYDKSIAQQRAYNEAVQYVETSYSSGYRESEIRNLSPEAQKVARKLIKQYEPGDSQGGYYVNPKTGQGFSSAYDLEKEKGYIRIATPEEIQSKQLTIPKEAPNLVVGTQTIKNLEITKVEEKPITYVYRNILTGEEMSSINKPSMLYTRVFKRGNEDVSSYEQGKLSIEYQEKAEKENKVSKKLKEGEPIFYLLNPLPWLEYKLAGIKTYYEGTSKYYTTEKLEENKRSKLLSIKDYQDYIANPFNREKARDINKDILYRGESLINIANENIKATIPWLIFSPAMATSTTTVKIIEPEFRVKPLAPKQPTRSTGIDFVNVGKNEYMFKETITVPKRYQYVNTPTREYLGYEPYKKLYSRQVKIEQSSISPFKLTSEGAIEEPAIISRQRIYPYSPRRQLSFVRGGSKIIEFDTKLGEPLQQQKTTSLKVIGQSGKGKIKGINILGEGQQQYAGYIEDIKFINYKPSTGKKYIEFDIKYPKLGKTTTRVNIYGLQKKIIGDETKEVYGYYFTGKGVTYPMIKQSTIKENQLTYTRGLSFVKTGEKDYTSIGESSKQIIQPGTKLKAEISTLNKIVTSKINPVVKQTIQESPSQSIKTILSSPNRAINTENKAVSKSKEDILNIQQTRQEARTSIRQESLNRQNEVLRSITIPRVNEVLRETNRVDLSLRNINRQIQRVTPRQTLRQINVPRTIPRVVPKISPYPSIRKTPTTKLFPFINFNIDGIKDNSLATAYKTFIIKQGKKVYLPGYMSKGLALQIGERKARETLVATFGITKTSRKVLDNSREYRPGNMFRDYRISKGKKIPLDNTYIQKMGTRLSSVGEVTEIQRSRKK